MPRTRHPHKDIERALRYAEDRGWRVEQGGSHAWGKLYCPYNDKECRCGKFCISVINSTPRNPEAHARQIERVVSKCIGGVRGEPEE